MYKNNVILLPKVRRKYKKRKLRRKLVSKIINGGKIILSKYAVCNTKKSRFIKKQEAKGLLSNLVLEHLSLKFQYCEISCFKIIK